MSVDTTTFTAGSEYAVRLSGSSAVGGTSVVGIVVGEWSVQNRSVAVDSSGRIQVQSGTGAGQLSVISGVVAANTQQIAGQTALAASTVTFPGSIMPSGNVTVGAYAASEDPATLLFLNPANKLATDSSGRVLLQPTQAGVTIPTVTTVTNQLTAAQIATGVWTDTTSSDFSTTSSPGKILVGQLGGVFTSTSSSVYSTGSLANVPTGGTPPTAAQIATAVWQDTTASNDFTISGSVGKLLVAGPVAVNVTQWGGNNVPSTHVNGVPIVDVGYVLGNAASVSNGTAQGGASTSITLASTEPSTTNFYVGSQITIVAGTASGQARFVTAYNGATKVATVHRAWDVTPDATSQYTIDSLIETDVYQFAGQNVVLDANNSRTSTPRTGTVRRSRPVYPTPRA